MTKLRGCTYSPIFRLVVDILILKIFGIILACNSNGIGYCMI